MNGRGDGCVLGVDLGTGGARAVVVAPDGEVLGEGRAPIAQQEAVSWWEAARGAVRAATRELEAPELLQAMCVDATSGSIVGVDRSGRATTPALMYDDERAAREADELDRLAAPAGTRIGASFGVARMRWIERHLPEAFAATHCFAHQADVVVAGLTGRVGTTDSSNALKSGFDPRANRWGSWLAELPELAARLPEVVAPGAHLGRVTAAVADDLGLPRELRVVAGVTDGTAAFLASGAHCVGDDNTTLGTTLVFKRLAEREVEDPDGLLYCHRLAGRWLPGAASNTGADWIRRDFPGADLHALDEAAVARLPTGITAYPLCAKGERFPFRSAGASGFLEPEGADAAGRFAAQLQGTAFVERLGYEVLDRATGTTGDVHATGGGARSDVWTQLRADVTGRTFHRPARPESAFGAAVLAAGSVFHGDPWEAARRMVRVERTFEPDPARTEAYEEPFRHFVELLEERRYVPVA